MKKLLSVILVLALLVGCAISTSAVAEEKAFTIGFNNFRVGAYSLDILQKNFQYACEAMGVDVMVVNDEAKIDNCPVNVDNMIASGVDAVVFFGLNDNVMISIAQRCENAGIPFAFYDHMPSDTVLEMLKNYTYYVGTAATMDLSTGRVAGNYAASIGATKAVIVTGENTDPSHSARTNGFVEAFEAAGGEVLGIGYGNPSLTDSLPRANDLLTAYPEADFIYGTNGHCGLAAKEALASHPDVDATVYVTDLDPDVLTSLEDGTVAAASGAHWINVYFAAALMVNYLNGNTILDSDGNAPRLIVPVMTLPEQYIDLYSKLWIESYPFTQAELAALVSPDVSVDTLNAVLDSYSIDNRIASLVEQGVITQGEVDAAIGE